MQMDPMAAPAKKQKHKHTQNKGGGVKGEEIRKYGKIHQIHKSMEAQSAKSFWQTGGGGISLTFAQVWECGYNRGILTNNDENEFQVGGGWGSNESHKNCLHNIASPALVSVYKSRRG